MLPKTPNLSLNKWESTDAFDVDQVNANFDNVEKLLTPFICTSTTRPTTNRFIGRRIFETDTNRVLEWINNRWSVVWARLSSSAGEWIVVAESGWTLDGQRVAVTGGSCSLYIWFTRTGATIPVPATGDIGNTRVCSINSSDYYPAAPVGGGAGNQGRMVAGYANDLGEVSLVSTTPGGDIQTGNQLSLSFTYAVR